MIYTLTNDQGRLLSKFEATNNKSALRVAKEFLLHRQQTMTQRSEIQGQEFIWHPYARAWILGTSVNYYYVEK